jgi:hypothetical protein
MFRRAFVLSLALAATAAVPAFAQCDTRFRIVNQTDQAVREIYIDSSALPAYTVDRLGREVMAPGAAWEFTPQQAGLYDIKVVMMNDAAAELRQVDVCRVSVVNVTPNGLQAQ